MTVQVGDNGLAFAAGSPYSTFAQVSAPKVGDSVILYNLGNGQRLAVPTLWFDLGYFTFVAPSFQFAGFDWKFDFNFNLLPLKFGIAVDPDQYVNFAIENEEGDGIPPVDWQYGNDDPPTPAHPIGTSLRTDGYGYKYPAADFAFLFENLVYGSVPDAFIDVKRHSRTEYEIWAGAPTGNVGAFDISIYYGGTLLKFLAHGSTGNADYHGILPIL